MFMIRESFYRVFKRKRIFLILLVIIGINVFDIIPRNALTLAASSPIIQSAFVDNIMINGAYGSPYVAFTFLSFILASLPMADCLVEDRDTGINKIYLLKISKKKYLRDRFLLNFVYGGLSLAVVIFINLLVWMMLRPSSPVTHYNVNLLNNFFLIDLLEKSPIFYYIAMLLRLFVVGGTMASFAMFLNDLFKSRYIGIGGVFILDIVISLVGTIIFEKIGKPGSFGGLTRLVDGLALNLGLIDFLYLMLLLVIPLVYFFVIKKDREVL